MRVDLLSVFFPLYWDLPSRVFLVSGEIHRLLQLLGIISCSAELGFKVKSLLETHNFHFEKSQLEIDSSFFAILVGKATLLQSK